MGHDAEVVLGDVDAQALHRLIDFAVNDARNDLRLTDGELEVLPAHHLNEDRQLEFTAALDLPGVGALGLVHPDRHIADELLLQPRLNHAGGELLAALARKGCSVDAECHRDGRLINGDHRKRYRIIDISEGLTDGDLWDAGNRDDVTGACALSGHPG